MYKIDYGEVLNSSKDLSSKGFFKIGSFYRVKYLFDSSVKEVIFGGRLVKYCSTKGVDSYITLESRLRRQVIWLTIKLHCPRLQKIVREKL